MEILLINYDNGSRYPVMPQNLYQLKRCCEWAGHNCEVMDFNLTKDPYDKLCWERPDVIGLGFISGYWPHREAIKIAEVVADHPQRKSFRFILGGHGPSAAPEYYLKKLGADAVFKGSADISLPAWLKDGMPAVPVINSQGYNLGLTQVVEEHMDVYKRISFPNTKPHEFAIQLLSGRGCPYKCAFCYRMGEEYQRYDIDSLIEDIKWYYHVDGITHFQFSDELLMGSLAMCEEVVYALIDLQEREGMDLAFDCNGRVQFAAEHPDMLNTMRHAGFRYINYGCESMSQSVLDNINKKQTVKQIKTGIKNTVAAKLTPGLNFMWGNPGDDESSLWDAADFIVEWSDGTELRTIRPVTPYPGTELFNGLGITVDQFYEQHTNSDLFSYHFVEGITNEDANEWLYEANKYILDDHIENRRSVITSDMRCLYYGISDPLQFRGFREV